jgi:hypothetical protein
MALHGQRLASVPASLIDGTGINLASLARPAVIRFWGCGVGLAGLMSRIGMRLCAP